MLNLSQKGIIMPSSPIRKLVPFAEALTHAEYSRNGAAASLISGAQTLYAKIWRASSPLAKAKWFVRRIVFGIGSILQVP